MTRTVALLAIAALAMAPVAPAAAQQPQQQDQQAPATGATSTTGATPTTSPTSPAAQNVLVGSDSIVGSTVRDGQGRDVGKVSRLMIDPADGKVANLIIETGGRLGVGGNTVSVPWNGVKIGQDQGKVIVTASQMLDSAPNRPATSEPTRR